MTLTQIETLKEFAELFNRAKQLYSLQSEPLTIMPYKYGKEIGSFIEFCSHNNLVLVNYHEIESEFTKNYQDPSWYTQLTENQLLQCLSYCIRRDRFVDGFLAARIEDESVNKVINALAKNR